VTLAQQLSATDAKLRQLTAAVEQGGQLSTLLGAIERREQECARLRGEVEALGRVLVPPRKDRKALERALRTRLADRRGLLRAQGAEARQVLETLLEERLVFTPTRDEQGEACYQLRGTFAFGRIFAGLLRSHGMASLGIRVGTRCGRSCNRWPNYGKVLDPPPSGMPSIAF
jgi:hypothetical protein